ncbi:uncharacterized protein BX663DRAFT_495356 [Cokeromyces recurvatus]|uniref:uncharacterized protein n=1 Tax=Cokeromyces recurvatus TaxID=90255 RepID=UPI0022208BB6|nr:uncharacterized protein BX663DRAFT_495356 [Cokeromyces recurvatus]KAI7907263.1 hypothetical protein BX663DRAFT_495356 [Cokeromyces recurvatus]
MKATLLIAFLIVFISFVIADNSYFYFTNPVVGSSFTAGQTATITWINGTESVAKVTLLTGTHAAIMDSTGYNFTIHGADDKYDWVVPTNLPQNATFAFKVDYTDSKGAVGSSYSSAFNIIKTTGDVVVTQPFVSLNMTTIITTASSPLRPTSSASLTHYSASVVGNLTSTLLSQTHTSLASTPSATTTPIAPGSDASILKGSIMITTCSVAILIFHFIF